MTEEQTLELPNLKEAARRQMRERYARTRTYDRVYNMLAQWRRRPPRQLILLAQHPEMIEALAADARALAETEQPAQELEPVI